MNKYISISIILSCLLIISLVSADLTVQITGTGNKTFNLYNVNLTSNNFSVSPSTSNATLFLNGNNIGPANSTAHIPLDKFNTSNTINKNNINFTGSISAFSLNYSYYRLDGLCPANDSGECPPGQQCIQDKKGKYICSSGGQCNNDNNCDSNEDCIYSKCCSNSTPLNLLAQTNESCPGSAIPVVISKSDCTSIPSVSVDFYLSNASTVKLIRQGCTLSGDTTWHIVEDSISLDRCGVIIPATGIAAGVYNLKANYTISSKSYTQNFGNVTIAATCGVGTTCGHSTGFTVSVSPPSLSAQEFYLDSSSRQYYLPKNSVAKLVNMNALVLQCSNGVAWSSLPGLVVRTYSRSDLATMLAIGDNNLFNGCHLPITKSRDDLLGPNANRDQGYLPPGCDISVATNVGAGSSPNSSVATFTNPGKYLVVADYINAYCDSPDYICPYINKAIRNSSICSIGSMASDPNRATGWVHLSNYNVTVINSNITVQQISSNQSGGIRSVIFNVSNVGIGKVNIIPSLNTQDLIKSIYPSDSSFNLTEKSSIPLTINLSAKGSSTVILPSLSPRISKNITLNDYSTYSFENEKLIVNYSVPFVISYDDSYGFATQSSQTKTVNADFSLSFECDGSQNQTIYLRDKIFSCTCSGKGFCVQNKTENDAPCACISSPSRGEKSENTLWTFNAKDSYDYGTSASNLLFEWFYDKTNEKIYNGTGLSGASFIRNFPSYGNYFIRLEVKDEAGLVGIDRMNFTIANRSECYSQNGGYYWFDNGASMPSLRDCKREENGVTRYCCASGLVCQSDPSPLAGSKSNWSCTFNTENNDSSGEETLYRCEDYKTQTSCTQDSYSLGTKSVNEKILNGSLKCGSSPTNVFKDGKWCSEAISGCRCYWKAETNKCLSTYSYMDSCPESSTQCIFATEILDESCQSTGLMHAKITATWMGEESKRPASCKDGEVDLRCGQAIQLSFFNSTSLVLSIISLVLIYLYLVNIKRKSN